MILFKYKLIKALVRQSILNLDKIGSRSYAGPGSGPIQARKNANEAHSQALISFLFQPTRVWSGKQFDATNHQRWSDAHFVKLETSEWGEQQLTNRGEEGQKKRKPKLLRRSSFPNFFDHCTFNNFKKKIWRMWNLFIDSEKNICPRFFIQ